MATRTIANAGGNWSSTGTWVEGAVPTGSDDVVATATSGNLTLTAAGVCRSIDFTNYVAIFNMSTFGLTIGSTSAPASNIAWRSVAGMTLTVTTTSLITLNSSVSVTITTGGKTMPSFTFNSTGTWTLQDACSTASTATVTLASSGTLNTNGQTCSWGFFGSAGTLARTLTLGSSSITITGGFGVAVWNVNATNLTITANTATVTFNSSAGPSPNFSTGNWNGVSVVFTGSGSGSGFTCTGTITNFTYNPTAGASNALVFGGSFTITGILTLTGGGNATQRILVQSSSLGTARALTVNGSVVVSWCDFEDITGAGTGSWDLHAATGLSGDCGGNSGMTLTAPQTNFWVGGTGNWMTTTTNWATSSGGAAGSGRIPLPQDNVVFDANSFTAASQTVTHSAGAGRICTNMNWTGVIHQPTIAVSTTYTVFGSITWASPSLMTISGQHSWTFAGRGTATLTNNGQLNWLFALTVTMWSGTFVPADAFSVVGSGGSWILTAGTIDNTVNNVNISAPLFNGSFSFPRTLKLGTGTVTLTGLGVISVIWAAVGVTLSAASATIVVKSSGSATQFAFSGNGATFGALVYAATSGSGGLQIGGSNTFGSLTVTTTTAQPVTFSVGTTQTITGSLILSGAVGNLLTVNSSTPGTAVTISCSSGVTISTANLSLTDNTAAGTGSPFLAGLGSTIGSNVTNWLPGAYITSSDSGSGAELTNSMALADADSGSGLEGAAQIAFIHNDQGTGNEANSISAATSGTDAVTGVDGQSLAGTLQSTDSGTSAEGNSEAVGLADSDHISGVDAVGSLPVTLANTDTWHMADAELSHHGILADADAGTALDAIKSASVGLSDSDSGSGVDAAVRISLADVERMYGADVVGQLLVTIASMDSGSGVDAEGTIFRIEAAAIFIAPDRSLTFIANYRPLTFVAVPREDPR